MANPIVKPDVPYTGKIPGGLVAGRMCRIQGVSHPEADRFDINLQTGPSSSPRDDTALHLSVRHNQGYIARNSYKDEEWGEEIGDGDLPIGHTESWEILILVDEKDYKVAINGQHFCEFPHRIPFSQVQYLLIHGTVTITLISWEGIMGLGGQENATKSSQVNAQGDPQFGASAPLSQGGYAPPPQGGYAPQPQGGYFPPQGYGGYGPAPGYGAPPQGYGPPVPPGAEPQKGFDFLDTAQSLLAGAIKSGAAANILSGFMSSGSQPQGQGYAHQNAKYGIYPELPQDMNLNLTQNKHEPGPVEKLLSGLLSGGTNQHQAPGTNPQGQQGQPVDIGALLTNLLSSHQSNQVTPSQAAPNPNAPGTQPSGDIGSFLTSLLSGSHQAGTPGAHQGQPGSENAPGGIDLNNLLTGLLSGNATRPLQENTGPGGHQPSAGSTHAQGPDIGSLLSGLLSGGGSHQNPSGPGGHQNPSGPGTGGTHSQGSDIGSLLSGLLSGGSHQNPPGSGGQQNPPGPGAYRNPPGYQPSPGAPQSHGIDLNSLLSGLLSSTGEQQTGGYQPPRGNSGQPGPAHQPPRDDRSGGRGDIREAPHPNVNTNRNRGADTFEDVSDQLAREMAREGGGGDRQRPQSGHGNEQYGQYPHPPQEHRGPMESLLSGLLSGGGGGQPQQPHQPQFGGGPSVGGLGSMSGLLENFAGQILHPRDHNNQRQNY